MASFDLETRAKEAFIDDHFELAVDLYSEAITLSPLNAELFADRAQANIKLSNFTEAVADANKAIELEPSMAKAYLRKGMACIKLEEYQTAKVALEAGAALASGDSRFTNLIKECMERIAEEAEGLMKESSDTTSKVAEAAFIPQDVTASTSVSNHGATVAHTNPKYRHEFYQKAEEVVVTIFAKGVPKNSVIVDFGEQIISVTIDVPGGDPYVFQPRLFGKIIPSKCRYEVLSTKVEIRLAKAEAIQWTALEYNRENSVEPRVNVPSGAQRPIYPSSKAKKDGDTLEAEVKKQEKNEKLDGDAALNKFFRQISPQKEFRLPTKTSPMKRDLMASEGLPARPTYPPARQALSGEFNLFVSQHELFVSQHELFGSVSTAALAADADLLGHADRSAPPRYPTPHTPTGSAHHPASDATLDEGVIPGRRVLPWLHAIHTFASDSGQISGCITRSFHLRQDLAGYVWSRVTPQTRRFYWDEFQKAYSWPADIAHDVEQAWRQRAAKRYRDFVNSLKTKWERDPISARPPYVSEVTWAGWIEGWLDHANQAHSVRNAANRRSGNLQAPTPVTHSGGSVSHATTMRAMYAETGEWPDSYDLFYKTHRKKDSDGTEDWVTAKARDISDEYNRLLAERGEEADKNHAYWDAVRTIGPQNKKKREVYGVGSAAPRFSPEVLHPGASSEASTSAHSAMPEDISRLDADHTALQHEMETIRAQHEESVQALRSQLTQTQQVLQQSVQQVLQQVLQQALQVQQETNQQISQLSQIILSFISSSSQPPPRPQDGQPSPHDPPTSSA